MILSRLWMVVCLAIAASKAQTIPPDVWEPVRSLIGSWEGEVSGQPGSGKAQREYKFVRKNKYVEVRNKSVYPAQPKNPKGEVHEDWGMISFDRSRKAFVLRQFHAEGFVNQYASEPARNGVLTFRSEGIENIPTGFRARETYTFTGPTGFERSPRGRVDVSIDRPSERRGPYLWSGGDPDRQQ